MDSSDVTKVIKALIVSQKGGMPIEKLEDEFMTLEGQPIPYLKMGYPSLFHYLRDVKEIKAKKDNKGNTILVVDDPKVNHLNQMIQNQKPAKTKKVRKNHRSKIHEPYNRNSRKRENEWHVNYFPQKTYSCSGSSEYKSSASSLFEEDRKSPSIFIDSRQNINNVHEPILNGRQLIGDDFFLQLAIRNLQVPIWRKAEKTALYSGLCVSGQSIRDCIKRLEKMNSISEKVTIMLGAVDIYQERSLHQMKEDFKELLNLLEVKFNLSRNSISICTLPPLANLNFQTDFEKTSNLRSFNFWLKTVVRDDYDFIWGLYSAYHLIDFYENFTNDIDATEYDLFQNDARNVSGTKHPWVLFNNKGRKVAMELLL